MSAFVRLIKEARRHPMSTARAVVRRAMEIPARGFPALSKAKDEIDDFDARYGVETAQMVQVVITDSPNRAHGERYQTTSEEIIRWCIEAAGVRYEATTFIDIGCGKGRALIVAAQYPFARVLGVEYSEELAAVCRRNLQRAGNDRCAVICEDAAHFTPPAGDLLVFMNNPFRGELAVKVLERLAAHPGKVVLAWRGPGQERVHGTRLFEETAKRVGGARLYRAIQREAVAA